MIIIGAGIAGVAAAAEVDAAGVAVQMYDRGHRIGGRMAFAPSPGVRSTWERRTSRCPIPPFGRSSSDGSRRPRAAVDGHVRRGDGEPTPDHDDRADALRHRLRGAQPRRGARGRPGDPPSVRRSELRPVRTSTACGPKPLPSRCRIRRPSTCSLTCRGGARHPRNHDWSRCSRCMRAGPAALASRRRVFVNDNSVLAQVVDDGRRAEMKSLCWWRTPPVPSRLATSTTLPPPQRRCCERCASSWGLRPSRSGRMSSAGRSPRRRRRTPRRTTSAGPG